MHHVLADLISESAVRDAEPVTPPAPDADGWIHLRLRMDWPEEVPSRLLALGNLGEVLEPLEIRQQVQTLVTQMSSRYGTAEPS